MSKVAIVAAGSRGIGAATTNLLGAKDYAVMLSSFSLITDVGGIKDNSMKPLLHPDDTHISNLP